MEKMPNTAYEEGWQFKWDDMKKYGPFSRHLRRIIKNMIRPLNFKSVLDVGCGQGSFLQELQSEFPNIKPYGIDISSSAVQLARSRLPGGRFWVMDITDDSLDQQCDLVVCSEVLEHIPDDIGALQNLRKVTGKYLLISTPQGRMRRFETQVGHVRNYASGELVSKVEAAGFAVLSVVEWGFPFYSPLYRNLLDLIGSKGTTGEFGSFRKLIAKLIYLLFSLNSSRRGDEIFVLATVKQDSSSR
ncbi:MAG: class I SAM-dependent methyltransferase [Nitrospirota bacterium]